MFRRLRAPPLTLESNIMASGSSVIRRTTFTKSNVELINSLRANFHEARTESTILTPATSISETSTDSFPSWIGEDKEILYVPAYEPSPLSEPRSSYKITLKLFYLPGIPPSRRCVHTKEAINLVLRELGVDSIDLLIASYPGVSFDADDNSEGSDDDCEGTGDDGGLESMIQTWKVLEELHEQGVIGKLGVSEFSAERLAKFLPQTKVRPSKDQINIKDCCVVPSSLIMYAKQENIELLTHNDCTNILPRGTTRELLGPGESGAGVLAASADANDGGLKGDVEPQWVVKYTAVVEDRGVIENKGYFAMAVVGTGLDAQS